MESKKSHILSLLSSSFLFCGLSSSRLQEIAQKTQLQTYRKNHTLIEEGIVNDKIFIIVEGLVKIYKLTPDGKEIFIGIEKAQDYLGIMDLTDKPASATVETLQLTKALVLYKKDLADLLAKNIFLWERMYRITLAKLEEYRTLQTITLGNDLLQRTFLLLQFLSRFTENNTIFLSHEHIAHIVGATRPRVTEALHLLRDAKKISLSSKRIKLLG